MSEDRTIYMGTARQFLVTLDTASDVSGWTLKMRFGRLTGIAATLTLTLTLADAGLKLFTAAMTATQSGTLTEGPIQAFIVRTDVGSEDHLADDWFDVKDMVRA